MEYRKRIAIDLNSYGTDPVQTVRLIREAARRKSMSISRWGLEVLVRAAEREVKRGQ